ncbi:MAG: hypothetical protein H7249_20560 [Chitinophagaceae bacterium]|nr:hypothetical protein [Oligoflexus sp.]
MLLRLYLPVLVLILLKNISVLDRGADALMQGFQTDYQNLLCARADVYQRNLADSWQFLEARYPYLNERAMLLPEVAQEDCSEAHFAVYREVNPKLPLIYPNWFGIETQPGSDGSQGTKNDEY